MTNVAADAASKVQPYLLGLIDSELTIEPYGFE
jgi:hypothetical protein